MEAELRVLFQGNVDVGILQETKLTNRIHEQQGYWYSAFSTEAEIRHWEGIFVFWREDAGWKVEGIVNFGPNVASLFLM